MKLITVALLFLLTIPGFAAPKPATFEFIEIGDDQFTQVRDINAAGDISGRYYSDTWHGFIRKASGEIITISFPGSDATDVAGIDDEGNVVGVYFTGSPICPECGFTETPFVYRNGQYQVLPVPNAEPKDVRGSSVVGILRQGPTGFLFSDGNLTLLNYPGAHSTLPSSIAPDGKIYGTYFIGDKQHGFVYSNGQYQSIDYPGAIATYVSSANSDSVVGGLWEGDQCGFRPFIAIRGKFYELDLPAAIIWGINESGMIVGTSGGQKAFIAKASSFILRGK